MKGLAMLLVFGLLAAPWPASAEAPAPLAGKRFVYLIPHGSLEMISLEELAAHYQEKLKLTIEALPGVQLEPGVRDAARDQLIAEELIALMKRQHPLLAGREDVILIGITEQDMYIRGKEWRFAFSYREAGRFAVVSGGRMGLFSTGEALEAVSHDKPRTYRSLEFQQRLRKMVTKTLGLLYYGLPLSNNPTSVMYGSVMGISELDAMGEEF